MSVSSNTGVTLCCPPVGPDPSGQLHEDCARQILDAHPRQNEESTLVDDRGSWRARVASSHPIQTSRLAMRHAALENCAQATTCGCGRAVEA